MVTSINLPADFHAELITKATQASAAMALVNVIPTSKKRDLVTYSLNSDLASFHNADGTKKSVSDDSLNPVTIIMSTLYKILKFKDFEAEDSPELIDAIKNQLPATLSKTIDVLVGGGAVVGSEFDGYTETPLEIDATAASFEAVFDQLAANGHIPNGAILDTSFIPYVKKASTEGTTTNPLNVNVSDGFQLGGVSLYFRKLGAQVGVFGDFSEGVLAVSGDVELDVYSPKDNFSLREENMTAVFAGLRVGYNVGDQTAFAPVTLTA